MQRSPQHRPSISEDEVRRWFEEVGFDRKKLDPPTLHMLVSRLINLKTELEQEMLPTGKFHPVLVAQATALAAAYERLMQAQEILRKAGRSLDDLDEVILRNFPLHSDYTDPDNRWHAHARQVYDLVITVVRQSEPPFDLPKRGGSETGPVMRVICNALEAVDGVERDAGAVRRYIARDLSVSTPKSQDRWLQFWRIKKFPEKWRWTKRGLACPCQAKGERLQDS